MLNPKKLSCGFAAGAMGVFPLLLLIYVLHTMGKAPAVTVALIYKDVTWGGLWGLLLALPWLTGKWWARGMVLGIAAAIVLLVFFLPGNGDPNIVRMVMVFVLHIVWGLAAAYWYKITD